MLRRVVRDAVLPAPPDHVYPGPGEDPPGVGVRLVARPGAPVQIGGPGVREPAVLREVDEVLAQLLVAGEAERDRVMLARLAGGRGCSREAGGGVRGGGGAAGTRPRRAGDRG